MKELSAPGRLLIPEGVSARRAIVVAVGVMGAALAAAPVGSLRVVAPGALIACEAAITLMALVAAGLWLLNFGEERRVRSWLVAVGLTVMAVSTFVLKVVPALSQSSRAPDALAVALATTLVGAMSFAAAGFVPPQTEFAGPRRPLVLLVGMLVAGAMLGLGLRALGVSHGGAASSMPVVVVRIAVGASGLAWAVAGLRFLSHGRRVEDGLLGIAGLLLALTALPRLRTPSLSVGSITPAFPLGFAALVLLGLAAVIAWTRAHQRLRQDIVAAERRRIAGDLHDGLAQDLAFIVAYAERLAQDHGEEHPVVVAARRALEVSRGVLVDLAASEARDTATAVRTVADELASRFEVEVDVAADPRGPEPGAAERRQIVRIVREAIANAARHGAAHRVTVELTPSEGTMLRISDDGRGMAATSATTGTALGMAAMRDRASALGGALVAGPADGGGTAIAVVSGSPDLVDAITD
jgi:signal transduction histidine kinase